MRPASSGVPGFPFRAVCDLFGGNRRGIRCYPHPEDIYVFEVGDDGIGIVPTILAALIAISLGAACVTASRLKAAG